MGVRGACASSPARAARAVRCSGVSFAFSVTSSPSARGRGSSPADFRAAWTSGAPKWVKTTAAASGSALMFHSVVGAVLPGERYEPPMITRRRSRTGSSGSRSAARATLVSGPSATSVSSPGRRRASSTSRSTACRRDSGRGGGGIVDAGVDVEDDGVALGHARGSRRTTSIAHDGTVATLYAGSRIRCARGVQTDEQRGAGGRHRAHRSPFRLSRERIGGGRPAPGPPATHSEGSSSRWLTRGSFLPGPARGRASAPGALLPAPATHRLPGPEVVFFTSGKVVQPGFESDLLFAYRGRSAVRVI